MHANGSSGDGGSAEGSNILDFFAKSESEEEVGEGTAWPFDFTAAQIDRIFLNVKKLSVAGSLPGIGSHNTKLFSSSEEYPEDGLRHHIFSDWWFHYLRAFPDESLLDFVISYEPGIFPAGKKVVETNRFYPHLVFGYSCPEGSWSSIRNEREPVGTLVMMGKSTPIYPGDDETPSGSVTVNIAESWVVA